jgi:hypothetical protein
MKKLGWLCCCGLGGFAAGFVWVDSPRCTLACVAEWGYLRFKGKP